MSHEAPDAQHDDRPAGNAEEGDSGEWKCSSCGNLNYAHRTRCNMRKCNAPRPGSEESASDYQPQSVKRKAEHDVEGDDSKKKARKDGDWECKKCGNWNFATRTHCNMRKCGAPREEWVCPVCKNINYKHRTHCNMRKCGAPRPYSFMGPGPNIPLIPEPVFGFPGPSSFGGLGGSLGPPPGGSFLPNGEWRCVCGNINFAGRERCNMRKCNAPRPDLNDDGGRMGGGRSNGGGYGGGPSYGLLDGVGFGGYDRSPVDHHRSPIDHHRSPMDHRPPIEPYERDYYRDRDHRGPPMDYHRGMDRHMDYRMDHRGPIDHRMDFRGGMDHRDRYRGLVDPATTQPGSWKCTECGNINYASRTRCNMKKCQAAKPVE